MLKLAQFNQRLNSLSESLWPSLGLPSFFLMRPPSGEEETLSLDLAKIGAGPIAIVGSASESAGATVVARIPNDPGGGFSVFFDSDPTGASVIDMLTRRALGQPIVAPGEALDSPLATEYASAGWMGWAVAMTLQRVPAFEVRSGDEISFAAGEIDVRRGETMGIDASLIGGSISFDGSAETDGSFIFLGGDGADEFRGGTGADSIAGGNGGDLLAGGGGADVFSYASAGQSSGLGYDSLVDFDAAANRIDLPGTVAGFNDAIEGGNLSSASFDADLAAALGAGGLAAGHAVLFAPDGGDLAGTVFLIVDGNGEQGYQAGEDFVFALPAGSIADLGDSTAIFI